MKIAVVDPRVIDGVAQYTKALKLTTLQSIINPRNGLIHHPTRANIGVANFRIAH